MKIFIGLLEIAGYCKGLKKGFEELGIDCSLVLTSEDIFHYNNDLTKNIWTELESLIAYKRNNINKKTPLKMLFKILHIGSHFLLFLWAILNHDVFIFQFGSSFFQLRDLPMLKFFRKKIIFIFHGTDSRPAYINGKSLNLNIEDVICYTARQKKMLKIIERYADNIISHPLSSQLHEKSFLSHALIGIPYFCENSFVKNRFYKKRETKKLRVLHAPSCPEVKGTKIVCEAIDRLKNKGYLIDFVLVSGKSNVEVLDELEHCDFVVDEVYSDTFMARFASEAAFFGKPAIVGGYAKKELVRIFPEGMIPPVHYCHPDEIEKAIETLIIDESYRLELGTRAKKFVEENWDCKKVAGRILEIIKGNFPRRWIYDPKNIRYIFGAGLTQNDNKTRLQSILERGGKKALQLSDKPELENMFVEFAYSVSPVKAPSD